MIKSIAVKNFRTHQDSTFEFVPGVNIIKGTSKNGKSNFTRACNLVLNNKPQGFSYKSWFSKEDENTEVTFNFDENTFVKRVRGKEDNEYSSTNDKSLKALRGEVPEEIKKIIQMSEVNLLSQHDKFFMLQDTAGERRRKLNAVVNLEVIDVVLTKADGRVKKINSKISNDEFNLETKQEELKQYDFLEEAEVLICNITKSLVLKEEKKERVEKIDKLLTNVEASNKIISSNKEWLKVKPLYEDMMNLLKKRLKIHLELEQIETLCTNIKTSNEIINSNNQWLEVKTPYDEIKRLIENKIPILNRLKKVGKIALDLAIAQEKIIKHSRVLKIKPFYEEINSLLIKKKNLCTKINRISILIVSIKKAKTIQNSALQLIKNLQEQYNSILKANKICPLCKREL